MHDICHILWDLAMSNFGFTTRFNSNKSYLARARLTPLFENEQQFNLALLHCYLLHQLKAFIVFLLIIISYFQLFTTVSGSFYLQIIGRKKALIGVLPNIDS